jgi:hypothetical protein
MAFYWSSAKYVKVVCGGEESLAEDSFENLRDWSIGGMLVSSLSGLVCLFLFFSSVVIH